MTKELLDYVENHDDLKKRDILAFLKVSNVFKYFFEKLLDSHANYLKTICPDDLKNFFTDKWDNYKNSKDTCSLEDIIDFFIQSFDQFNIVFEFVTEYEDILETIDCKIKNDIRCSFTSIICKLTNYNIFFNKMQKYIQSSKLDTLINLSYQLNKEMDIEAKNSELKKFKINLLKKISNSKIRNQRLHGILSGLNGSQDCRLYLFEEDIFLIDSRFNILDSQLIKTSNAIIHDKKFYIFKNSFELKYSCCEYFYIEFENIDSAKEMLEYFYRLKYQSEICENVCFKYNEKYLDTSDPNNVSKFQVSSAAYNVKRVNGNKSQDNDLDNNNLYFKIQNELSKVSSLISTDNSNLFEILKSTLRSKRYTEIEQQTDLSIIETLLKNVDQKKFYSYSVTSYIEDQVPFLDKSNIFEHFLNILKVEQPIIKRQLNLNTEHLLNLTDFLYENDILETLTLIEKDYFIRNYIALMNSSGAISDILKGRSLYEICVLFSMFIRRNIYDFLDPDDYEVFLTSINFYIEKIKNLRPSNKNFIMKLVIVCDELVSRNYLEFSKMIFTSAFCNYYDLKEITQTLIKSS